MGLQAQQDVAGAYEFDPAEDDADDSLEEQDEKGDDNLDDQVVYLGARYRALLSLLRSSV